MDSYGSVRKMSGSEDSNNDLSRRNVLKSAAGGAAGLAGVSQTAIAWAQPTEEELSELQDEPNVRAVLSELGLHRLPNSMRKASNTMGAGEDAPEFELWEGELEYGTLHVGRIDRLTNVVFEFAKDFRSTAPRRFRNIPEGTEPLVSAEEGEAFVRRSATEGEQAAIDQLLPVSGAKLVHTSTNADGFLIDVVRKNDETEEFEQRRFAVPVGSENDDDATGRTRSSRRVHGSTQDNVHPVFKESSEELQRLSSTTVQAQSLFDGATEAVYDVQKSLQKNVINLGDDLEDAKWHLKNSHQPWKKLPDDVKKLDDIGIGKGTIKGVVATTLAQESAEAVAGDCGRDCVDCGMLASDLLLNCHKCRIFLGAGISSTGPVGMVLFIVCVWNFCNFPGAVDKCSSCIECATDAAEEHI